MSPNDTVLYIADEENHRIRKVSSGTITTVAGNGQQGSSGDGGAATSAKLDSPRGVFVENNAGLIYIADTGNNKIRKVTPAGVISTIAGTGTAGNSGDGGLATSATLDSPYQLGYFYMDYEAGSDDHYLYIADYGNNRVRVLNFNNNKIFAEAGTGTQGYSGDGGEATDATFRDPTAVAADAIGNLYIVDHSNHVIRKVFK